MQLSADLLDERAAIPLYQQVYDLLQAQIVGGPLRLHDKLPAEQELAERLGVSRITVKRAMNELAKAGFVRRQRGIGTVVTHDAGAPLVRASFETMIEGLARMGLDTEVRLLDCDTVQASPAVRRALHLPEGASVQRIVRLRYLGSAPLSHLVSHIPEDVAERYDPAELAEGSLLALLERAGHVPVSADQTIRAVPAEAAAAANLGITRGSPLLCIHRIMRDAEDRPVQDITAHYRADRFEYRMTLSRDGPEARHWFTDG